jgi:Mn-dependent transcriptional regulator
MTGGNNLIFLNERVGLMTESEERYLKTIFALAESQDEVRSVDVADALGFSKASVSRAMKNLKQYGYISMEAYGGVNLTAEGKIQAISILERESIVSGFLRHTLEIDEELSAKYSALVAHIIDQKTLNKMKCGGTAGI